MVGHQLLKAQVTHTRTQPKTHGFKSDVLFFVADLAHLKSLKLTPWLNFEGKGLYRLRKKDYGILGQKNLSPKEFIQQAFQEKKKDSPQAEKIILITTVSCLGYAFNPISFYLIFNSQSDITPSHIILEVSNTYREQKLYLLGKEEKSGDSEKAIFELEIEKEFYISPFVPVDTTLKIRLLFKRNEMSAQVVSKKENAVLLTAQMNGFYMPLSAKELIKQSLKAPLQGLRVITLIHWHAFLLWLKRIPYFSKSAQLQLQKGLLHDRDAQ